MKFSFLTLGCLFSLVICLGGFAPGADEKPSGDEAKAAAAKWLDSLEEKGLVLNETVKEQGFVVTHAPSARGRVTKFSFRQPGWWMTLVFHGELSAQTPRKTLQEKFWFVTLDRIPTPGLNLPGWEVRPQTPTSSVKKGVTILAFRDGKMTVRVRTKFFALYGLDPSIPLPADAPAPVDTYFQIRREFPFDLRLEAPVTFK